MIKAIVTGVAGRMGKCISTTIQNQEGIALAGGTERNGSEFLGRDVGEVAGVGPVGKPVFSDLCQAFEAGEADVAIDFTTPEATLKNLKAVVKMGKGMVIGTTGMEKDQRAEIEEASRCIPIVFAPNMSVGINLMIRLIREAAIVLGDDFDIEIIEAHHRFKKDAPSGTAMKLAEVLAEAMGKDLEKDGVFARKGMIGERKRGEIGIQTLRAGDIVGDHTVLFGGMGERLEITHRASGRETFARGAVKAAIWLQGRSPGLYSMQHVLGLV